MGIIEITVFTHWHRWPVGVRECFCNENDTKGGVQGFQAYELFRRAVWQLSSEFAEGQDVSPSLLLRVFWLCVPVFVVFPACPSWLPTAHAAEKSYCLRPCSSTSLMFSHILPAPRVLMCAFLFFLRSSVIVHPVAKVAPTERSETSSPCTSWQTNLRTTHSLRWPSWLPMEAETGRLWSWRGWIQRPAWLFSRITGRR